MAGPVQVGVELDDADLLAILLQGPAHGDADGVVAAHDDGDGTGADDAADGPLDALEGVVPVTLKHVGVAAVGDGDGGGQHLLVGLVIIIAHVAPAILGGGLADTAGTHAGAAEEAHAHVEGHAQHAEVGLQFVQIQTDGIAAKGTNARDGLADEFRTHDK